jgi:hypothetical protein
MYKKENQYIKSKLGSSSAVLLETIEGTIEDLQNSIEINNNISSADKNNIAVTQQQPTTSSISSSSSASMSHFKKH